MSSTNEVRKALKSASGPMTAAEIGDVAGITGEAASKLLWAMVKSNEVEKQDVTGGRSTYIRNPAYKVKSASRPSTADIDVDATAIKPSRAKSRKVKAAKPARSKRPQAKKIARKAPRKPAAREAVAMPEAAPATVARPDNITPLQAAVRSLIRFAMASDRPLDAVTRGAVIDATRDAA